MRPLHVGIQLPEIERYVPFSELVVMARTAEQVGFDSLWLGDHLLYDTPEGPRGPWEVWTTLAALALATERIQLGPLVASTSFHAPAMLAKQASTVDAISGGRLILGLGAGWNQREYQAYGFAYDHRVSRFEEAFTIISSLIKTGSCDFHGRYYDLADCVIHPLEDHTRQMPIMVGSTSPRMLDITLGQIDLWNVWSTIFGNTVDGFRRAKNEVDEIIASKGLQDRGIQASCTIFVSLDNDRLAGTRSSVDAARGTPEELADLLRAYVAAGASMVQLVVDPITRGSIEALAPMLAALDQS